MAAATEVVVPDIGDFKNVDVAEVLVKPGDTVKAEQSLITVESDKASMEIPSSHAGVVKALKVALGDKVSEGSVILSLEVQGEATSPAPVAAPAAAPATTPLAAPAAAVPTPTAASFAGNADLECDVLVLGGGPGGYSAAFRAADLGLKVVVVERYATLGGVCLNVGCIPSKALLQSSENYEHAAHSFADHGIKVSGLAMDVAQMLKRKDKIVRTLTQEVGDIKTTLSEARGGWRTMLWIGGAFATSPTPLPGRLIVVKSAYAHLPGFGQAGDRVVSGKPCGLARCRQLRRSRPAPHDPTRDAARVSRSATW